MIDFIPNCLEVLPATLAEYKTLAPYHYRTEPINPTTQIYKISGKQPHTNSFPNPIAIIVYRMPIISIRARYHTIKKYLPKGCTPQERLKFVNKNIQYLARLIVDPRFRKIGLATWLVADTLERQSVPIIETLTPIDFTNKIFQKAGFKLYHTPAPTWYRRFYNALRTIGLKDQTLTNPMAVQFRLDRLRPLYAFYINDEIKRFMKQFSKYQDMAPGINRTKFFLSKIPFPNAYLIWLNPRNPILS